MAAAPSGGGTPIPAPSYEMLTQEQLDQIYKLAPYKDAGSDVVFRNGEAYYQDGTAQGGTYSDAMSPLYRTIGFNGVPETVYLTAYEAAAQKHPGWSGTALNDAIIDELYDRGYSKTGNKWSK